MSRRVMKFLPWCPRHGTEHCFSTSESGEIVCGRIVDEDRMTECGASLSEAPYQRKDDMVFEEVTP